MTYIKLGEDGRISAASDTNFPGSVLVDYAVVCGYDGKLYKFGEEPRAPDTEDKKLLSLRTIRNSRLIETDKYLLADYPINPESLEAVKTYRQALRDLPGKPGAPFDGGGELTPWPELPEV